MRLGRGNHLLAAAAALLLIATPAASARAASRTHGGAGLVMPGVPSAVPSTQAQDAQLSEMTGLSPSQVTTADVCSAPTPGRAQCAAEAIVLRSSHAKVHPRVRPGRTFTQVFPRGAAAGPTSAGSSSPAAAPGAGTPAFLQQAYDLT
jgi:hypothetical protein